ncbi:energy transducer TonB [Hymenobacter siberiensis]|jgi:protein TonB|uniref:energy transducer TonB n=1 Tax=Hymenobacter siberiensis TaxID=2848396 RepID=UPI001C1E5E27|nr:energy transducer TonB [Hymenobacter siberiensis]MBU6122404.1 energy transducer TonB [Hymenobacter siberiensis]
MKTLFVPLALLATFTAHAQTPAAPATGQTIILKPGNMQVQRNPAANRPDRAPVYPGGEQAMGLFFLEHINYPAAAKAAGITGKVLVNATVNEDGTTSNPVVAQSLSPECDAEALRVVSLLAGWQPAMRRSRPLPVLVQLPVPFGAAGVMHVEQVKRQPVHGKRQ